jgi:eukaryotic translation initiation factor 2C
MIAELLRTFYQTTGRKPLSILLYRDGISESQFNAVAAKEIKALFSACEELESDFRPKVTYVAVQKRHHARFFPIKKEDTDKSGNVYPGTVIDQGITHPSQFDFYLCSHPGLQGLH